MLIFTVLAIDLGLLNKNPHAISLKEAIIWSASWITLALLFNLFVLFEFGKTKALISYRMSQIPLR